VTARIAILGAGSWGTALAILACARIKPWLWARDTAVAHAIQTTRHHPRHLRDVALPAALTATSDWRAAVEHVLQDDAGLLILGVPVAGLEDVCEKLRTTLQDLTVRANTDHHPGLGVLWTCKGFHPDTGELPHQIVQRTLGSSHAGLGVLSGPSFAHEVAQGLPVALTVASQDAWLTDRTIAALHGTNARIYSSTDVVGVEVGGAVKNIMAIACGIADGLGLGENARAALITRGLAEMQRLGLALGARAPTFSGLTGVGDLVLTATGRSRNRQVGLTLAAGESLEHILASGMTAEGVRCARAALALGREHNVDMPITAAVCQVLFEGVAPRTAVSTLLAREARAESGVQ